MTTVVDDTYWRHIKFIIAAAILGFIGFGILAALVPTQGSVSVIVGLPFFIPMMLHLSVTPYSISKDKSKLSEYSDEVNDRTPLEIYLIFFFLGGYALYPPIYILGRIWRVKKINAEYEDVLDGIEGISESIESVESTVDNQDFQAGLNASENWLSEIHRIRSGWPGVDHEKFNLDELRARYYSVTLICSRELTSSSVSNAKSAAESNNLGEAVRLSKEAQKTAESVLEADSPDSANDLQTGVNDDLFVELTELQETAAELRSEWYREWLVDRVNAASEATENISAARDELDEIFQELSAEESIPTREKTIIREAAEDAYVRLLTREGKQRLSEGKQHFQQGSYAKSLNTYDEGQQVVQEAIEYDAESSDQTNLSELRMELIDSYWETMAARSKLLLKSGREQYDDEAFEDARDTFDGILEEIDDARNRVTSKKSNTRLPDIRSVAADNMDTASRAALGIGNETQPLRTLAEERTGQTQSHQQTATETTSARDVFTSDSGLGPPTAIPGVERQPVSYSEITQEGRIGQGGDADVCDASIESNDEPARLALKQPKNQGTVHSGQIDRFTTEAETWAKLDDHDYIVGVVDWGETPLPWILLEKMDGGNLATSIDTCSFEQAVWIAQCVTEAVAHAHSRGIAHLDLKPANILFRTTSSDSWPVPKVGDWGLSRPMLDETRDSGGLTPGYAAPEQIDSSRFGSPDQSTDIYQLGAVFYHLLTGRPPFVGDNASVVTSIVDEPVVPPSEVNPSLPSAVDDTLLKGLARDKTDRYESALYFRDRMTELAETESAEL